MSEELDEGPAPLFPVCAKRGTGCGVDEKCVRDPWIWNVDAPGYICLKANATACKVHYGRTGPGADEGRKDCGIIENVCGRALYGYD